GNMLSGDFGYCSVYRIPVLDLVGPPMRNTVCLNLVYYVILFLITIPLGIKAAVQQNSPFDTTVQVTTIIGISIPSFLTALIFISLFAITLPSRPSSALGTTGAGYTGLRAVSAYRYHPGLAVVGTAFAGAGGLARYVRRALLDALSMRYVRTARAKGRREKTAT